MKTRLLLTILLTAIFCACDKENSDSIPDLLDTNPKVIQISVPGVNDYHDIVIKYQGELIGSITRPGDSILFFYTNELLDSAIRYSICENGICIDEQSVKFTRDNGKIIQANFKTTISSNDTIRFRFVYDSDRLVAIKSNFQADTLLYTNEQITQINSYQVAGDDFIVGHYGELLKSITIENYINRPNPYYLISTRLGFPYFSCVIDNALGEGQDYYRECISKYVIEDNQLGTISGKLNYDYDDMGRIRAMYNSNQPDKKTLIQYQ